MNVRTCIRVYVCMMMEIHITFIHCILADNLAGVRRQAMCGPIGWWPTDVARSSTILQSMVQFRNTRPKLRCITGSVYLQRLDNPKCRWFNGIGVCAICVGVGYMWSMNQCDVSVGCRGPNFGKRDVAGQSARLENEGIGQPVSKGLWAVALCACRRHSIIYIIIHQAYL